MKILISEKLSEHKSKTPEGYLICSDAVLARTGPQEYRVDELFVDNIEGDANGMVSIDRKPEEVFAEKTIASGENKPLTFEHPSVEVNTSNYNEYSIGFVRDVRKGTDNGQDVLLGTLVVTNKDAIEAIESGEYTQLSCGYDCDIIGDKGNYQQCNIRINHVALCKEGRAGIARIVDSMESLRKSKKVKDSSDYFRKVKNWINLQGFKRKYKLTEVSDGIKIESEDGKRMGIITVLDKFNENWLTIDIMKHDRERTNQIVSLKQFTKDSVDEEPKKVKRYMLIPRKRFEAGKIHGSYPVANSLEEAKQLRVAIWNTGERADLVIVNQDGKKVWDSCDDDLMIMDIEPSKGETKEEFISRFMSTMNDEYPDRDQRLAVAYSYWRKARGTDAKDSYQKAVKVVKMIKEHTRKKVKDASGADIVKYQQWVDYDMKHYGHISQTTMDVLRKEGLTVVKDKYGDYEVIVKYKGR